MQSFKQKTLIFLILGIFTPLASTTSKVNAGSFGAEIFCSMRDSGNDHRSSWEAAYTYIKKQKGGLFKISPKQAASQIIETVVREREKFSYCVEFLDKLHPNRKLARDLKRQKEKQAKFVDKLDSDNPDYSKAGLDHFAPMPASYVAEVIDWIVSQPDYVTISALEISNLHRRNRGVS